MSVKEIKNGILNLHSKQIYLYRSIFSNETDMLLNKHVFHPIQQFKLKGKCIYEREEKFWNLNILNR